MKDNGRSAERRAIIHEWLDSLTVEDRQIAVMWAAGYTQAETAAHPDVHLSQQTVSNRIRAWLKKSGRSVGKTPPPCRYG